MLYPARLGLGLSGYIFVRIRPNPMKLTHSPPFKTWQSKNLPLTQYETRLITAPVAFITRAVIRDLISAFFIMTILSKGVSGNYVSEKA